MQTVNISLPPKLAEKLDQIVKGEGYASRSEFIRALLRFYVNSQEKKIIFSNFKKLPLGLVKKELNGSGKYNDKFINSVITGLGKSSAYAKD